jgi:isopenicillin N synthase-like dioxygenase
MRFPLLDLRHWRRDPHGFAEELRHACHHIGFFQVKHRIPSAVVKRATSLAREFFALPAAAKQSIDYSRSPQFRGYMANGVENTAGKPDLREQVEIAPEGRRAPPDAMPPHHRLLGPNQWPEEALPGLRPAIEEYVHHAGVVADELTQALCLALGWERRTLETLFKPGAHWQLKLAQYSPASSGPENAKQSGLCRAGASVASDTEVGVGAHTDSGWLTLLLQDNSGGLEAFAHGEWRAVPPLGDGIFVCNLGEVAEMISGGYLLATPHRVLLLSTARISVPYFYNPNIDAMIEQRALPASLPWEREAGYEAKSHWRRDSNAFISSYGLNAFKSLARSHPAVFERHHPDLVVTPDGQVASREPRS